MVEQAAECRWAQSGLDAFSFFVEVLRLFEESVLKGFKASAFRPGERITLDKDLSELGFFQFF